MALWNKKKSGFTLVELVVVIVIIGILAAIAIPRLSRGSAGASTAALSANLSALRNAINMYAAEHNNAFPGPDNAGFVDKLTKYTDLSGATGDKDTTHRYGPYLAAIPPCPIGSNAGKATAADVLFVATSPPVPNVAGGEGWVYNATTGEIRANTADTEKDDGGKVLNTY